MNEQLAKELVSSFTQKGKTFAAAESLTAGMIAGTVGSIPGASEMLIGGVVSYANRIKHEVLGVDQAIIDEVGVVSEACACEMARGVRRLMNTDVAVSATGLAGPGGSTPETPVGTVFIGVSSEKGTKAEECHFTGSRLEIRAASVKKALELALEAIS